MSQVHDHHFFNISIVQAWLQISLCCQTRGRRLLFVQSFPLIKSLSLFLQTTFCPNYTFEASSIKELGHLSMSRSGKRVKAIPPRHSDEGTIEKRMSFYSKLESEYPSVTLCMHPHKTCNFRFTESKGRGEKSKRRDAESKGRGEICREQREEGWGAATECYFRVKKHPIYICFFFKC